MTMITASELSRAINGVDGSGFDRLNPESFRVTFPSSHGGVIVRDATVAEMAALLPQACEWAHADMADLVGWLNTLTPESWEPDRHELGAVIDRRTVEVQDFAFFGGPGTHMVNEVLVRADVAPEYSPDYERVDPPRNPWEPIQVGDTFWAQADRAHVLPKIEVAAS